MKTIILLISLAVGLSAEPVQNQVKYTEVYTVTQVEAFKEHLRGRIRNMYMLVCIFRSTPEHAKLFEQRMNEADELLEYWENQKPTKLPTEIKVHITVHNKDCRR
jgi:cytosine/adenosine deaminase-related metal-dependent hydrolase